MKKIGLLFVVVISIVFAVSCVSKEVSATETYYQTEMKTENYIDVVNGEEELTPETNWYCENLVMSIQPPETKSNSWHSSYMGVRSFSGIWYLGYKLIDHSSSKIIIQTWDRGVESSSNPSYGNTPLPTFEQQDTKNEMISVYDMSNTEHLREPPFDKPQYVIYHYIGPGAYDFKSANIYPEEEKQFNEWLDRFNVQLKNLSLGTQFSCDNPSVSGYQGQTTLEYQFDTTGIKTIAVIIAGREYRGIRESVGGNIYVPSESDPWPIKSIKLVWSDNITKQRQAPYQVEKQRTVMQTKKVPFWEAIFH